MKPATLLFLAAAVGSAMPAFAQTPTTRAPAAQAPCPDGRTLSGACVKPGLAQGVRKNVLVQTQSKLSYTAPPYLPTESGIQAVPRDAYELRTIYGINRAPICTTTGGGAAPLVTVCR